MPRKAKVHEEVAKSIGLLDLDRELLRELLNAIHTDIPKATNLPRFPQDDRYFIFQRTFTYAGTNHTFIVLVDDCSSPDHLLIEHVSHVAIDDI
jgi:hypothetical protein